MRISAITAFAVAASATVGLGACGGETKTDPTGTGGSTSSSGGGGAGGAPTGTGGMANVGGAGGNGGAGTGGADCTTPDGPLLAIDALFFGDTDFDGTMDPAAWQSFGFDLDGQNTTNGDLSAQCKPNAGGTPSLLNDGPGGLDNSFGRNVLPIFLALSPGFSNDANLAIASGDITLMALLEQLTSANQSPVVSKIYGAIPFGSAPSWTGTDCWPVSDASLNDPLDYGSAKLVFPNAEVAGDLWQSNGAVTLELPFVLATFTTKLTIHQARMQMQLDPSHGGASLGQIGGVLDTEEFIEIIRDMAGTFDPSLCSGSTFDSIANQIRQTSDVMVSGVQDPNQTCDGISLGLGYTMSQVLFGAVGTPAPPANPCP